MANLPFTPARFSRSLPTTGLRTAAGHLLAAFFLAGTVAMAASIILFTPGENADCFPEICSAR